MCQECENLLVSIPPPQHNHEHNLSKCMPVCLHHVSSLRLCMCVWTATWSGFLCVKQDCDTWATGPRSWMSWRSPQFEWWGINPFWFSQRGRVCVSVCVSVCGWRKKVKADGESKLQRWQGSKSLLVPNCGNYSMGMDRWRRTKLSKTGESEANSRQNSWCTKQREK